VGNLNRMVEVEVRYIDVDVVGHVLRIGNHDERVFLSHQRSTLQHAGRLTHKPRRNLHPDLPVFRDTEKVGMQDNLTDGMELHILQDCLAFLSLDIEVYEVRLVRVDEFAEQDHRRIEMYLSTPTVKYAGNVTFFS